MSKKPNVFELFRTGVPSSEAQSYEINSKSYHETTVEDIIKGFEKIKYEAREVQTTDTKSTESTQH